MKIEKYKKNKDNTYQITFDNDLKIDLYDDTIIKYNLLIKKEITEKEFNIITEYNEEAVAYYKSLKYINIKLRCEHEIRKYLSNKDINNKTIDKTIERLNKEGYLNNKLYIESYVNDQINLSYNGYDKILNNLLSLGFDEIDIKIKLDTINKEIWISRIEKLISKKIKTNHTNSSKKIKDKIIYDLINLGYKKEDIVNILENISIDDSNIFEKDYKKLFDKLSKKYSGSELNYQLKNKLYQKGYSIDLINKNLNED